MMKDAVAMQRKLVRHHPHPNNLADAINDLGMLFNYSGDYGQAEARVPANRLPCTTNCSAKSTTRFPTASITSRTC